MNYKDKAVIFWHKVNSVTDYFTWDVWKIHVHHSWAIMLHDWQIAFSQCVQERECTVFILFEWNMKAHTSRKVQKRKIHPYIGPIVVNNKFAWIKITKSLCPMVFQERVVSQDRYFFCVCVFCGSGSTKWKKNYGTPKPRILWLLSGKDYWNSLKS